MEFKYYIAYAKLVQPGDLPKKFEKVGKKLKKYKMELVFWGHPFGTSEGIVYLMKEDVKDYQNAMMQNDLSEAMGFITDTRTHFVISTMKEKLDENKFPLFLLGSGSNNTCHRALSRCINREVY